MRVFIVSTVRDPGPPLCSFVRYHLRLGFAGILLFFDDPLDPWLPPAQSMPGVMAIPCTPELRARQQELGGTFAAMSGFLTSEVMARQVLNAELAIGLAREQGADWLVHLDVDELFASDRSLVDHFSSIPADVGQVTYLNHEAFPETTDVQDYFTEVTLFKRHPALCSDRARKTWLKSAGRPWYFLNYDNGKSAVRVAPGASVRSVHLFQPAPECPRTIVSLEPAILHYANCGFEYFSRKYRQRGRFSDNYFEKTPRLPFHLESRDLFWGGASVAAQRKFYRRHVLCSPTELPDLMNAGLGMRVCAPRAVLECT